VEAWLDGGLGPDGRLWLYHETLPVIGEMEPWALVGIPGWGRRLFHAGGPMIGRSVTSRPARRPICAGS